MRARDNPYRTERLHALSFRLSGADWGGLRRRFLEVGARGCLLGPEGSGKTTLMESFARRFETDGLLVRKIVARADEVAWKDELADCADLGPEALLLVDGADLLGRFEWRRLLNETRRAFGLLATSHRRRLLPILYRCRTSSALLESLMRELHPGVGCGQPTALELFARHRGNLREALLELYDYHAKLGEGRGCRL